MINAWHLVWIVPLAMVCGAVLLMAAVSAVLDRCEKEENEVLYDY